MNNYQLITEEARLDIPTLLVSCQNDDPDETNQDILLIPVTGPVGQNPIERAFCKLAHDLVSGVLVPDRCPMENGRMCQLTGHRNLCLFADFDDPLWQLIRESVARERETA